MTIVPEVDLPGQAFANAPDVIRAGVVEPGLVAQLRPWLHAMQLWGRAAQLTATGLGTADQENASADRYFADARKLAVEAAAVQSIPGATRFDGPIKIADGVLDRFVADAPTLIVIRKADNTVGVRRP